ncbi:MAG: sigma-54-dependent Fis family transcriptional regulator [Pirellulales bacterium]|jgi:Nif-specific regulatory protein|nr:sigma-54-dependent Fis family transcriptional regulator [Thermoguttaceae bacterium]MDD4785686.1 sigma-54-dependent Fis family transcriptional regulator [Pirellulales bacterium]
MSRHQAPRDAGFIERPELAAVAAGLLIDTCEGDSRSDYLDRVVARLCRACRAEAVVVLRASAGEWSAVAWAGDQVRVPGGLASEAMDRESLVGAGAWVAVPVHASDRLVEVLAAEAAEPQAAARLGGVLQSLLDVVRRGLRMVETRLAGQRRLSQLEAMLEIANQWNRAREVGPLLEQMAEAATRLLGADRASIFLWDRRTRTLVGRPALGVEQGELRVPDDRGVVGQVVRSGQPLRVDSMTEPERINRQVDQALGYQTRTILCVPLRSRSGEVIGAFELLNKGEGTFDSDDEDVLAELAGHAVIALENAQDRQQLMSANRQITDQAAGRIVMIGESPAIQALRSIVQRVADTDLAVLILGENGTGKEVVAQRIHYLSRRRDKPFIAVNCAAIPDTLAESELFGHEKGAFTDAQEMRPGKFELAADGTLLLDEIGDLSPGGQAKLLRVLEEKVLVRVGGAVPIATDARVVAATNQSLARMVGEKRFREDLYFRLNVVTLEIPPLRERPADIMLLARHFLGEFCRRAHRPMPEFSPAAIQRLEAHRWPGNVRELRNLMERLAYLSPADRIEAEDLAFILSPKQERALITEPGLTLASATSSFQRKYIEQAVERSGGNMSRAAESLGLHRSNLYRKMRQLDMPSPD